MRVKKCVTIVLVLAICAALSYRIVDLNGRYPKLQEKRVEFGEDAKLQEGVTMRIEGFRWRTMDEALDAYGQRFADEMEDGFVYRTAEVTVGLENVTDEEQEVFMSNCYFEKGAYSQGLAPEIFFAVNSDRGMNFVMSPHESCQVTLGYVLFEFQFQKRHWKELEHFDFYLTDGGYPVKTEWFVKA